VLFRSKEVEEEEEKKSREEEVGLSEKEARTSKPTSKNTLRVRVIDSKFYERQDIFGAGDPYVIIRFNNEKCKTKVYHNTKNATYNEGKLYNI
jgi:hypothetical protein